MIRYLIKNNIKMMIRSPFNIFIYVFGPTIVAAVLISAFNSLLESYDGVDTFEAGYIMEEGSEFESYIDELVENFEENDIRLIGFSEGDPEELMKKNDLAGFVEFGKDDYTVYESEDHEVEGHILEYSLSEAFENAGNTAYLAAFGVNMGSEKSETEISVEYPEFAPAINSADYYGIIEILYFASFPIICGAAIFSSEKKYKISRRYTVSSVSSYKLIFGKMISIGVTVTLGSVVAALIGIVFMDVHWGNPVLSFLIMTAALLAFSTAEIALYSITDNIAATIIITFTIVWLMGFFGGTFETYMLSAHPQTLKNLSLLYYENRAITELSSMGHSDYASKSLMLSGIVCATSACVAVIAEKIRRGKA